MKHESIVRTLLVALLFAGTGIACDSGQSTSSPTAPPGQSILGNIQAEVAYVQTHGQGQVVERVDPNTPDPCCFSTIVGGQRVILLNPNFLSYPPAAQQFFLGHEYGHHYLNHSQMVGFRNEYEADAFGIRVTAAASSVGTAQQAIAFMQASPNGGDATHPSTSQRVAYMTQVLNAFVSDPTNVPAPPVSQGPTFGVLIVTNTTPEPGFVFINLNANPVALLASGASTSFQLTPGRYRIDLQGQITGVFYIPAIVDVVAGQTVRVP